MAKIIQCLQIKESKSIRTWKEIVEALYSILSLHGDKCELNAHDINVALNEPSCDIIVFI